MNLCSHCCLWQPPLPPTVCVHTTTALTYPWSLSHSQNPLRSLRDMFGNETTRLTMHMYMRTHSCCCELSSCLYWGPDGWTLPGLFTHNVTRVHMCQILSDMYSGCLHRLGCTRTNWPGLQCSTRVCPRVAKTAPLHFQRGLSLLLPKRMIILLPNDSYLRRQGSSFSYHNDSLVCCHNDCCHNDTLVCCHNDSLVCCHNDTLVCCLTTL